MGKPKVDLDWGCGVVVVIVGLVLFLLSYMAVTAAIGG